VDDVYGILENEFGLLFGTDAVVLPLAASLVQEGVDALVMQVLSKSRGVSDRASKHIGYGRRLDQPAVQQRQQKGFGLSGIVRGNANGSALAAQVHEDMLLLLADSNGPGLWSWRGQEGGGLQASVLQARQSVTADPCQHRQQGTQGQLEGVGNALSLDTEQKEREGQDLPDDSVSEALGGLGHAPLGCDRGTGEGVEGHGAI
jgi:hypothetical protein